MGYPTVKYDVRHYSVSDEHPEVARYQQVPELARWKLYYIHTMLVLPLMRWAHAMPYITSGYRDQQLNALVGSHSRQHMAGEAVDLLWPEQPARVMDAVGWIEQELYHATGYCILYLDVDRRRYHHIHWALPLGFDRPARKNPERFWYNYEGGLHTAPPAGWDDRQEKGTVHEWS